MLTKKFEILFCVILTHLFTHAIEQELVKLEHNDRKIGIFSGGLLATHSGDLKIESPFQKSSLKMPTQLGRIFKEGTNKQRLTRIYDRNFGTPINVWHATSKYKNLSAAIKNLAQRKGTSIDTVFYIKTILPHTMPTNNEKPIIDSSSNQIKDRNGNSWYILNKGHDQMSLHDQVALAKWASDKGYTAVMWTGFGKTSDYELLKKALDNQTTLKNTKEYIRQLPDVNDLTPFEKNIITDQFK